ncbi:MAG: TolC family protein [Bacteroidota bacterium]
MPKAQALLKNLLILFFFLCATGFVRAQDSLSIEQAIEIALKNNPDISVYRLQIARVEAQRAGATFFLSLPEVDFGYRNDALTNGNGFRMVDISVMQEFSIAGQGSLRRSIASANIERARAEALSFERNLIAEVRRTYARLAVLERRVVLMEQLTASAQLLKEFAEESFKVGRGSEFDASLARIDDATIRAEVSGAESDILDANLNLNLLMGRAENTEIHTVIDTVIVEEKGSSDSLFKRGFAARADFRALEQEVAAAEQELQLANLVCYPNVRAGLTYDGDNSILEGIKGSRPITHLLGFRVAVAVPLSFGGLYNNGQAEILQRTAERDIAVLQLAALRRRIEGEITLASRKYEKARAALLVFNGVLPEFQLNLDVLNKAYTLGQIDLNTLLTQKERMTRSQQSYLDVLERYLIARSEYYQTLGFLPE